MSFIDELKAFGPDSTRSLSLAEAERYCAELAATHYENFSVVSILTPRELKRSFANVYAFCRWSDDLGDEIGDPARSLDLLAWWREELRAMYAGSPKHPVMIALAETVRTYRIPIDPFEDLIAAFEQDQTVHEYETIDQLLDYCTRSADPVGRLVLYMGGVFNDENARLSDFTCSALQLANFWQDVARDLAIGRIYLPREDRVRFGVSDDDLKALRFTPAFAELLAFEVDRARSMLFQGRELLPRLKGRFRLAVDLFNRGGSAILDAIERSGFDVLTERPRLSKMDKIHLIIKAIVGIEPRTIPRVLNGGDRAPVASARSGDRA
jgi:squalene synthase HpnC